MTSETTDAATIDTAAEPVQEPAEKLGPTPFDMPPEKGGRGNEDVKGERADLAEAANVLYTDDPEQAAPSPSAENAQPQSMSTQLPASNSVRWSDQDMLAYSQLGEDSKAFLRDLETYERHRLSIDADMEQNYPQEAEARRAELREMAENLTQRHESIKQREEGLHAAALGRQIEQAQAHLDSERKKLNTAMPDLDADQLTTFLTDDLGFAENEIANVADHRLIVMAEEARQFRELKKKQKKKFPTVKKKKRKSADPVEDAIEEAKPSLNGGWAEREAALRAMYPSKATRANPVPSRKRSAGDVLYGAKKRDAQGRFKRAR